MVNGGDWTCSVGSAASRSRCQHLSLFDLLRTHHVLAVTLEVNMKNGHHIHGPPFQVSSREVIRSLGVGIIGDGLDVSVVVSFLQI